ncbi:MAG: twin-arginine translocation signal domain-containing protein, partial [SAR324 cluster bacterium]|nr:twin-arginine translocation signal domain-containing protein [SAR324 cluster bacterium]
MSKKQTAKNSEKLSRRKFLRGGALAAGAVAAGAVAAPNIARAQTEVLKVQAAWGGGIFLEFAKDYVRRVNQMAGGSMKIDLLSVGAVVKTAEMQTAVHKGVLDGAHMVTAYWYSKSPVASLFGTGPCFGWSANEMMGWIQYGGGKKLYYELMHDRLRLNLVGFFSGPMPAQPLGWFKEHITSTTQMKGLKYR